VWERGIASPSGGRGPPFDVQIADLTEEGVGLVSPKELRVGEQFTLSVLTHDLNAPILRCQVIHCARSPNGFAVGARLL
jgi:hypothetical protein